MSRHSRTAQRLGAAAFGVAALSIALTGTALAIWTASGSGTNVKSLAGSITAPSTVTVPTTTVTNGTVSVNWAGATAPAGASLQYLVERKLGTGAYGAAGGTCGSLVSGTSCSDAGVPDGTYTYRVTSRLSNNWQAPSASSSAVTVTAAKAKMHIKNLSVSGNPQNGQHFGATVTITVVDATNAVLANVTVSGKWSPASPSGNCGASTASDGTCTVVVPNNGFDAGTSQTWTVTPGSGLVLSGYSWDSAADLKQSVTVTCDASQKCSSS